jgi:hypothetical protein
LLFFLDFLFRVSNELGGIAFLFVRIQGGSCGTDQYLCLLVAYILAILIDLSQFLWPVNHNAASTTMNVDAAEDDGSYYWRAASQFAIFWREVMSQ